MSEVYNLAEAIEACSVPKTDFFYYAKIDNRIFAGKNGKILYRSVDSLKKALRNSKYGKEFFRLAKQTATWLNLEESKRKDFIERKWKEQYDYCGRIQIIGCRPFNDDTFWYSLASPECSKT